jgi:hypothetical protein
MQQSKEEDKQYNSQKRKTNKTTVKRGRQTMQQSKEEDKQYNSQKRTTNNTTVKRG